MLRSVSRIAFFSALFLAAGFAAPASASPSVVPLGGFAPGTIVVKQGERSLYLALQGGSALRYPVAVGKAGKAWRGYARVQGKYVNPAWSPPAEVKRDKPWLPDVIAGGAANNPMGSHALTLSGGEYAIHGTNRAMRASIGTAASYGCIRMYNEDIADLYSRVGVGTPVAVLP